MSDPHRLRREILAARVALRRTAAEIEGMAGAAPFDPLTEAMLILRRVGDLLHSLSMVVVTEAASLRGAARATEPRRRPRGPGPAGALAARDPRRARRAAAQRHLAGDRLERGIHRGLGRRVHAVLRRQPGQSAGRRAHLLVWSSVGILVAYLSIVFVLPYLQGFGALTAVLLLVLLPAGLMAGTPSHAWAGIALGGWTVAEIGFGNVFKPDELAFVNSAAALILGMIACLAVIAAMPVTSRARRGQSWQRTSAPSFPRWRAAKSCPPGRDEIVAMLAALLPRLALDPQRDEDFFRGTLSMASSAIELGRLREFKSDAEMPGRRRRHRAFPRAVCRALEKLAATAPITGPALTRLRHRRRNPHRAFRGGAGARAAARSVLRAAASLHFIADRFEIDRAYLERRFAGDEHELAAPPCFMTRIRRLLSVAADALGGCRADSVRPASLAARTAGFYRFVWHRSLFNLALYVLLVGGITFLGSLAWL